MADIPARNPKAEEQMMRPRSELHTPRRWAIKQQEMARRINAVKLAHEIERRAWWPEWENMFFGPTLRQAYAALVAGN